VLLLVAKFFVPELRGNWGAFSDIFDAESGANGREMCGM